MPRSYDEYREVLEELSARCKRRGLPLAIWEKPLDALAAVRRLELEETSSRSPLRDVTRRRFEEGASPTNLTHKEA